MNYEWGPWIRSISSLPSIGELLMIHCYERHDETKEHMIVGRVVSITNSMVFLDIEPDLDLVAIRFKRKLPDVKQWLEVICKEKETT